MSRSSNLADIKRPLTSTIKPRNGGMCVLQVRREPNQVVREDGWHNYGKEQQPDRRYT